MNKKSIRVSIFVIILITALIYSCSPPNRLSIEINEKPIGVQDFYIKVTSSRPTLHGRTVKTVFTGLVPSNNKTTVPLDQNSVLWGGRIVVTAFHPEYFRENALTNNSYFLPKAIVTPTAWKDALKNKPIWSIDASTKNTGMSNDDINILLQSHNLILVSNAIGHISTFNKRYLDYYLKNGELNNVRKSVEIIDLITGHYNQALKQSDIYPYLKEKWMKKELKKMNDAYSEIFEKIN